MKLKWHIHGDHCLTLETGGGRAIPSIEWQGEALRRVSAGWNREPDIHTLDYWLRGGLPENGGFLAFERRAQETLSDREMSIGHGTLHDWVWANANWEYPGAITFEREEEDGRTEEPDGYVKINDEEAGEKLREAADEADVARALRPRNPHPPKSSLSGAQGKIAVHIDENGRMSLPRGHALSSWIVKVEHRSEWPGEAGIESVCQRALTYLEIDAATTTARIIDGIPVVMSKRSDRSIEEGRVIARHQEDWLQAYGKSLGFKYDRDGQGSGYASLYAIVRRYASDPDNETRQLTTVLAAACAWCNGDLHRKNLGLTHSEPTEPVHVSLAPIYDFSSQCGVPRTGDQLTIGIGGMIRAWDVDENRWRELAKKCRLDADTLLETVRETVSYAPHALAAAREECADNDEYRDPVDVAQTPTGKRYFGRDCRVSAPIRS